MLESVAAADGGSVPSIADLAPASDWDEREAHDLYGVHFRGHEPLRPLLDHVPEVARWTVPVRGHDPHQVAVGPIHAGVIESGHFRFHLVGDRILLLDARLFYKHRGLERAAEGLALADAIGHAQRACAACAVSNGVAYAQACEQALGLLVGPAIARARTVLLELERVWSHLNDVAAICAGVGLAAGTAHFAGLTEQARRLNARLTGHRFLFDSVRVGGSDLALGSSVVAGARADLADIGRGAARGWRELIFNTSFMDRLPDIGVVSEGDALRLGAVGPAARAAGVAVDARTWAGERLSYHDHIAMLPERAVGDVQARVEQRELELTQSLGILDELLHTAVVPGEAEQSSNPLALGVGVVESPRGRTVCVVEHDGERVERLRLRTGSYCELAGGRVRRRRQPAPRLPVDQQELRALLRVRRPMSERGVGQDRAHLSPAAMVTTC